MKYFLLIFCLAGNIYQVAYAQRAKDEIEKRRTLSNREEKKIARKKQPASKIPRDRPSTFKDLEEEYKDRLKKQAKITNQVARKSLRKKNKKYYRDSSYFGHKRKPKRRPIGKKKLCKECGIIH